MSFPATDQLRYEHRTMERLLERFESNLSNPQGEGLRRLALTFAEIQKHLAAHFSKEEEVFYPELERVLSQSGGMFNKLNDDHTDVRETSAAIQALLDEPTPGADLSISLRAELSSLGWELWNQIHHHIEEEEQGLLAIADRTLDADAQIRVADTMSKLNPK